MTEHAGKWLRNNSKVAKRVRDKDWSQTSVGSLANWPVALRYHLNFMLESPFPMFIGWGDGLATFYNDACEPLFGQKSDPLGKPFLDIWPGTADTIQPHIDKVLGGESSFIEDFIFNPDYTNGHDQARFDYHLNPLRNGDGDVAGIVHIFIRRDERSEKAENPEESYRNLELVLGAARMGTWEVKIGTSEVKTDYRHDQIFGYPDGLSEWGLETLREHILPEERNRLDEAFDDVFDDGIFDLEAPVRWPDGSIHWIHDRGYVEFDENDWPHKIAGITVEITDQKETEQALRKSEKNLRLTAEAANMHLCEVDLDKKTFLWPDKVPHEVDFPMPETFQEAEALLHPEDKSDVMNVLSNVADGAGNFEIEFRVIHPSSKKEIWVYSAGTALKKENDDHSKIVGVTKNITDRKVRELREQFISRLGRKLQQVGDPKKIMDVTVQMLGEFLKVDRCTYAEIEEDENHLVVLGSYSRNDIKAMSRHGAMASYGKAALNYMRQNKAFIVNNAEEDRRITEKNIKAYRENDIEALICTPLYKDGRFTAKIAVHQQNPRHWATEEVQLVRLVANHCWEALERVRLTNKLEEINQTLEQRVERRTQKLQEQEEQFRKLTEASSQMVWTTNAEGFVTEDSPSWRRFTGQTVEEWKGEGWLDVVHPEDRVSAHASWQHAVKTETVYDMEFRVWYAENKTWHWTKVRAVPLHNNDGDVRGWVGMSTDINERKQAEEAQREYQHKLRSLASELNKAEERERQHLAEELHNNLGQMLAVGKMRLDTLAKENVPGKKSQQVAQIGDLINDALVYTRELMSDLKPPPAIDKSDLTDALAWVAQKMKKHGLDVSVENKDESLQVDEEVRTTIRRCVRELLFNVVKHAEADEAHVIISRKGNNVKVEVRDGGKGFDIEKTKFIPDHDGGFGLFNVRERMDWVGGGFDIWSKPGEGTRAKLYAPLKGVLDENIKKDEVAKVDDEIGSTAEKKDPELIKVLLVDDHEMMRKGLRKLIEGEEDMTIFAEASNGKEAIQIVKRGPPDVIVMDVNLPDIGGIETTQKINAEYPGICIIGLSLYDKKEVARDMKSAGAADYLTKTDAFHSLCKTIRKWANK